VERDILEFGTAGPAGPVLAEQRAGTLARTPIGEAPAPEQQSDLRFGISTVFALASLVLALASANLARLHLPALTVLIWLALTAGASLLPLVLGAVSRWRFGRGLGDRNFEFLAMMLGGAWALMPALFFEAAPTPLRTFCGATLFAVAGLGAFAFARSAGAAVGFVWLIAGATGLASWKVGGEFGTAFAISSALYGVALSAMVASHHQRAVAAAAAREEIRRQRETVSFLLNDFEDGASDWLWETGRDFTFTYASPRLAMLLGVEPGAVTGVPLTALAGPDSQDSPQWAAFQNRLLNHQPVAAEELASCIGGYLRWLRLTARPLFDSDGVFQGYRGVGRDITAERLSHAQLVEAKQAAEQANAAKSQFLAVMSHELRTPLNAIVGFAELLNAPQADNLSDETRSDHLRTIVESSRHLQTLIDDILDATRVEKGTMRLAEQDGDAAELLEVAAKMCRDLAETANCTIIARVSDGIELHGDLTRIKQILINLLTNAIKFSPSQGYVYASLERGEGGSLVFVIRDGGVGIAQAEISRMFEPFVQAEDGLTRRFGGMGLGLSIARKLARLHGGDVTLASEPGSGTTARLILPSSRVTWPLPETAATSA
jgi:hypothetical protein